MTAPEPTRPSANGTAAGFAGRAWGTRILLYAISDGVPRRSFAVAVVVGLILNLINQGDVLLNGEAIDWWKFGLTFCVPYLVCTYGAVSYRMNASRRHSRP
ncbi:MAG: nitrate/nitrite transporter NrtS [Proteobacteria bacterium]|nr:nitrate/nitrite transporter NrtS [Pseudomonadota bacterium]